MQPLVVVELEVGGDTLPRLGHVLVGFEVDLLVLETAPKPFGEDIIGKAATDRPLATADSAAPHKAARESSYVIDRDAPLEITTSAAPLVTLMLGALIGQGHYFTAITSAIVMTMLLAWKEGLSRFAGGSQPAEIQSAVLLSLLTFVIYPLLPDRFIDPFPLTFSIPKSRGSSWLSSPVLVLRIT
jgi:hypothetical protein